MATNTFERKIELRDDESIRNLINVVTTDDDRKKLNVQPFSDAERKRSEELLNQSLLRSLR